MALDEITPTTEHKERPADAPLGAKTARRRLIDADSHMDAPHEMWRDYLPAKFREHAPTIEEGEEHDWIVFEGSRRPLKLIAHQAGRDYKDYKMFGKRAQLRHAWLPEQRLADMDFDGIDATVLYGGGPLGTSNPDLYIASFDAYNRWLWDFCGADRRRLFGVAYLPMRDVDETRRMLREMVKLGYRTVNIPAFPQSSNGLETTARAAAIAVGQGAALTGNPGGDRSYRDPAFDPFWAEVSDLDVTLTMHLGGRVPRFGDKVNFLPDVAMSKVAMAEPVAIAIFGYIFARFPKLRLILAESGVGWFAWLAEYLDRNWEKQRYWTESKLTEKPSFYMDQNVYGTFIDDRLGILNRNMPGGRNIMWSSDYPHAETNFPRSHEIILRDFADVPETDINEIVCGRARRVYGMP